LNIEYLKIERTKELERKENKAKIDLDKNIESIKIIEEEINSNENIQLTTITPTTITPTTITTTTIIPTTITKTEFDQSVNSLILSFLYMLKSMNIFNYNQNYINNFKNAYTYINFPEGNITKYNELNETIKKIGIINLENLVSTTLKFENIKFFLGCVNSAALDANDVLIKYKDALGNLNLINLSVQAFENIPVITLKSFKITNDYINGNETFRISTSINANIKQKNCYYNLFLTPNQDLNNYNILYIYSKTNNNLNNLIQFKINFFEIKDSLNYQSNFFEKNDFKDLSEKVYKLQSVIYEKDNKYYCIYKYKTEWYDSKINIVADLNEARNLVLFAYSTDEKEKEIEKEIENELKTLQINEEPAQVAQIPINANKITTKIPCNANKIATIVANIDIDNILNQINYKINDNENMVINDFTKRFNDEIKKNVTGFCRLEYNKNTNNFTVNYTDKKLEEQLAERGDILNNTTAENESEDEWDDSLNNDQIAEIKKNIKEKIKNMVINNRKVSDDKSKLLKEKLKILQENKKIIKKNIKKVEEAIQSKTVDDKKKEAEAEEAEAAAKKAAAAAAAAAAAEKAAAVAATKAAEEAAEEAAALAARTARPQMNLNLQQSLKSNIVLKKTSVATPVSQQQQEPPLNFLPVKNIVQNKDKANEDW